MKQGRSRYSKDTFVVYHGEHIIAVGTKEYVAKLLKIDERTVSWYATPRAVKLFEAGKIKRMAVRISAQVLDKSELPDYTRGHEEQI